SAKPPPGRAVRRCARHGSWSPARRPPPTAGHPRSAVPRRPATAGGTAGRERIRPARGRAVSVSTSAVIVAWPWGLLPRLRVGDTRSVASFPFLKSVGRWYGEVAAAVQPGVTEKPLRRRARGA